MANIGSLGSVSGEILGLQPVLNQVAKTPERHALGQGFGGMLKGYNDSPVSPLAGSSAGNPVYGGPPDEGPPPGGVAAPWGGASGGSGGTGAPVAGEAGDLAPR